MYLRARALFVLTIVCYCKSQPHGGGAHPPGVPPPVQQQGQQPGHHGGGGHHSEGLRVNAHDAEHIKEHLKDVVEKPKDQMTPEELEFHYFKLHDYDNNNKLDGTEISKAITHFEMDHEDHEAANSEQKEAASKVFGDTEIANIVDSILVEDDLNGDGYIEYVEFVTAQRKSNNQN